MRSLARLGRLGVLASLFGAAACSHTSRTRCQGNTDVTTCRAGDSCVWMHLGSDSAYFCATSCGGGGSCPSGQTCASGAASSCATCQDLLDVCE